MNATLRWDDGNLLVRNGLGGRGVDVTEVTRANGAVSVGFPIYDAHGNDVATLRRDGSGGFAMADRRSYDAWGAIRQGATTNGPRGRYCASLGHTQDDETGLVYMRARYYEPGTGRFVSEDPGRQGLNWFAYCNNKPVCYRDPDGRALKPDLQLFESCIRSLLSQGRVTKEYFDRFMDKDTGVRRAIHDDITGQGYSREEIMDTIEADCDSKMTGEMLGDTEDLMGDLAAGKDPELLLLEEQTVVAEVAEGGLEG